jgi:hypothetical protein
MLQNNLFLIIIILLVLYYINNNFVSGNRKEGMSLGVVQQMAAQDNQNIAINGYGGSINHSIRAGDFAFRYNQPSKMIAGTQRGARANRTNRLQLINDAYTGDYAKLPLFDIAKPIIYDELNLQ